MLKNDVELITHNLQEVEGWGVDKCPYHPLWAAEKVYQDGEHWADLLAGQMELSRTPKHNQKFSI